VVGGWVGGVSANKGEGGGDLYPKIRHSVNEQIPIASHIASDATILIGYVNDNVLRRARRVRDLGGHSQPRCL
jgi:hypothetical protein